MDAMSKATGDNNPFTNRDGGIAALCVRRPVLAVVMNLMIVIAGFAAYGGIEVRELPNVDRPILTVRTSYSGAAPETVDKDVTAVVEGAVARTPGVVSISSRSSVGQSRVTIEFDVDTDIDVAANDLRDALGRLGSLPEDADPPQVLKANSEDAAVMQLAATSATLSIQDLTRIVEERVIPRIAAVDGVADVQTFGNRSPLIQVILKPDALAARQLTPADLSSALSNIAYEAPAGSISDYQTTLLVRAEAAARSADEIAKIQISPTTRVSDVADVIFGPADRATSLRVNGRTGLGMAVVRQARANTLSVSAGVRAAMAELKPQLPADVDLQVTSDDAEYIGGAIHEVIITLLMATAIVVAVIYLFLRSLRVTLIPAVTVPIALIGTLAAMWVVGFSINILTLLALVLATGMVVDDAIVVIENITRQRALGLGPRAAAVLGTRQVFFAVLSTTATLAAVFIPISFLPGVAGSLFSEFGFVLAFAVVLSSVVALTLAPMIASRVIGARDVQAHANPVDRALVGVGEGAVRLYARLLNAALDAPLVVVVASLLFAGAALIGFRSLPSELAPSEDRGVVSVSVSAPQGSTVDYADVQIRDIEAAAAPFIENGEAANMFSMARNGGGNVFLRLAPFGERTKSQDEIAAELSAKVQGIPGISVRSNRTNGLNIRTGGSGFSFSVLGDDYPSLIDAADRLATRMEADPAFARAQVDYNTTQAQMLIKIDRERASELGIPVSTISSAVQTLLDGRTLGTFNIGDEAIQIRLGVPAGVIQDANDLDNIQLRAGGASGGMMVPLSSLVSFQEAAVAPSLPRQDLRRAIPISPDLAEGVDMRTAVERVRALAAETLPSGMSIAFTGDAKELNTTSANVARTFLFAVIVVLLVLAAQFESFTSAFILIATVPFGLAAAVFAILLTGGSLNIYSQIGLVMLVGLMAKNGILIVEFANQLRDAGQSVGEAIRNASLIRLRPVVMTMVSTVLGGLPLILRSGAGTEARHALGWIIVGGLGFATVATLFLTPVVFSLLARFSSPRTTEERRLANEMAAARVAPGSFSPTPEEIGELPAYPARAR